MKTQRLDPEPDVAKAKENALDFLKSRLQIAAMDAARGTHQPTETTVTGQTAAGEADDLVLNTQFEGNSAAWQHGETIIEFLRRLPVAEPATSRVGPWLWVGSKMVKKHRTGPESISAFENDAVPLLDALVQQRSIIEQQNSGKAVSTITRKMGPYRDQLQIDLLNTATKHGVTCGKWMLFPKSDDLPRAWRLVAEATADGKLGPTSKVGTYEPENITKGTLICVYTYDFSDIADVKRILCTLFDLSIVKGGMRIYYKCDAYTYLNISSENGYKLRASLYTSDEVLNDKVKYADGVISRLQKRGGAMEDFLTS